MKCVACRKDEPTVTDAEIAEFQPQVSDWEIVERDGVNRLTRVFSVDDFAQALEFTKKVGELAEDVGLRTGCDGAHEMAPSTADGRCPAGVA